jgi:hypothetical protein
LGWVEIDGNITTDLGLLYAPLSTKAFTVIFLTFSGSM